MNNLFFSRKNNDCDEKVFTNRAQNYYPEILNVPENSAPQKDETFDINDLSQFQQDFSYLQNSNHENFAQNAEKMQKNAENFEKTAPNFDFSKENDGKFNFENQNPKYSSKNDNFFAQDFDKKNQNQKNEQKIGINMENIMNFLKNGLQTDLLSSALASGVFKNQNPVMVETLSKMLSQKKSSAPKKHSPSPNPDFYEEM